MGIERIGRARRGAFSLVELLVVCAVIALLLSIAVPSLYKAMHAAKLAKCMSNQRQVAHLTQGYMADHFGHLPAMNDIAATYTPGVVLDPADTNPYVMPALSTGAPDGMPMSYGLNVEYAVYGIGYSSIPNPGKKVVWFDGVSGRAGGIGSPDIAVTSQVEGNDKKTTITHVPPDDISNAHAITVGNPSLAAHLAHGDPIGDWSSAYGFSAAAHIPGAFNRPHPVSGHVGVVAFADWHVESRMGIDPDMFVSPEFVAAGLESYLPPPGNGNGNGSNH